MQWLLKHKWINRLEHNNTSHCCSLWKSEESPQFMGVEIRLMGGETFQQRALLPEGGSTAPPRHSAGAAGWCRGWRGPIAKEESRNSFLQSVQSCCRILDEEQRRWSRHRPLFLLPTPLTYTDKGREEMMHLGNVHTFIMKAQRVLPVSDVHIREVVSVCLAVSDGLSSS